MGPGGGSSGGGPGAAGAGVRLLRSILFAPGSRPDRFAKALAAGADAVCLDLEDGVAPAAKDEAREAVVAFLAARGPDDPGSGARADGPRVVVRVNDVRTDDGARDLEALARVGRPDLVMLPKVEGTGAMERVAEALGEGPASGGSVPGRGRGPGLLPLIETVAGLHRVEEAARMEGLAGVIFGGMDLSAELGARFEWEPLLYARSRVVHAAALAGVGAVDVPWAPLDDPEGLEAETRRAARLGFTGKLAIHPAQVPHIHRALRPGDEELAWARRVVEADAAAGGGVVVVDGKMVDRPIVLGARRVLARAPAEEGA